MCDSKSFFCAEDICSTGRCKNTENLKTVVVDNQERKLCKTHLEMHAFNITDLADDNDFSIPNTYTDYNLLYDKTLKFYADFLQGLQSLKNTFFRAVLEMEEKLEIFKTEEKKLDTQITETQNLLITKKNSLRDQSELLKSNKENQIKITQLNKDISKLQKRIAQFQLAKFTNTNLKNEIERNISNCKQRIIETDQSISLHLINSNKELTEISARLPQKENKQFESEMTEKETQENIQKQMAEQQQIVREEEEQKEQKEDESDVDSEEEEEEAEE